MVWFQQSLFQQLYSTRFHHWPWWWFLYTTYFFLLIWTDGSIKNTALSSCFSLSIFPFLYLTGSDFFIFLYSCKCFATSPLWRSLRTLCCNSSKDIRFTGCLSDVNSCCSQYLWYCISSTGKLQHRLLSADPAGKESTSEYKTSALCLILSRLTLHQDNWFSSSRL